MSRLDGDIADYFTSNENQNSSKSFKPSWVYLHVPNAQAIADPSQTNMLHEITSYIQRDKRYVCFDYLRKFDVLACCALFAKID